MQRPKWIPRWLNLSFVIFVIFLVWMLVAGDYNFYASHQLQSQINDLKTQIQNVQDSTDYYERKIMEFNTDAETLEKIAREQHGMKKDNEDIYITDIP